MVSDLVAAKLDNMWLVNGWWCYTGKKKQNHKTDWCNIILLNVQNQLEALSPHPVCAHSQSDRRDRYRFLFLKNVKEIKCESESSGWSSTQNELTDVHTQYGVLCDFTQKSFAHKVEGLPRDGFWRSKGLLAPSVCLQELSLLSYNTTQ